jgi:hypothetical protein
MNTTKTNRLMNARFVAGLAVAAIPIVSLLGAASASAAINIVGEYHNTVGQYEDLRAIFGVRHPGRESVVE